MYDSHIKIIKYKNAYKKPDQSKRIGKKKKKSKEDYFESAIQRTKTAITDYSLSNNFNYFCTLTLDPKKIDRYDYDVIVPQITKFLRKNISRYLLVPEKHKDGAFHFHLLADIPTNALTHTFGNNWSLNSYTLGYSNARPIKKSGLDNLRVSYYIQKYITKQLIQAVPKGRKRYWVSRGLCLPTKFYNQPMPKGSTLVHDSEMYQIHHVFLDKDLKLAYNANTQSKLFEGNV